MQLDGARVSCYDSRCKQRQAPGRVRAWGERVVRPAACARQGRMKRLEGVRLEVDSRRHTVAALGAKIEAQRARLPQTRSKGEFQMEQTIRKMQHKENKLAGARPAARPTFAAIEPRSAKPASPRLPAGSASWRGGTLTQTALLCAFCSVQPVRPVDMHCLFEKRACMRHDVEAWQDSVRSCARRRVWQCS